MPLVIVILFVWFPDLVVEVENDIAIFQHEIHPISLENRKKIFFFNLAPLYYLISDLTIKTSDFKVNVRTDQVFVLQNETLILCALESEGNSNVISQTKALEVSWQGASQVELCFTSSLHKNMDIIYQLMNWHT